ncbi:hypothetical protein [Sulfitobacter sp. M13]
MKPTTATARSVCSVDAAYAGRQATGFGVGRDANGNLAETKDNPAACGQVLFCFSALIDAVPEGSSQNLKG